MSYNIEPAMSAFKFFFFFVSQDFPVVLHHPSELHFCLFPHSSHLSDSFIVSKRYQPESESFLFEILTFFTGKLKDQNLDLLGLDSH